MKNQNDLIVAGAVVLVCIGVSLAFMFTKRDPGKPNDPPAVVTKDAEPAAASVTYANSLPGSAGSGTGPGGAPAFNPNQPVAAGAAGGGPQIAGAAGGGPTAAGAAGGGGVANAAR